MKSRFNFVMLVLTLTILIGACALGTGIEPVTKPTQGEATAAPAAEEDLEYEEIIADGEGQYGEHGFTKQPGDYWTPIVLPDISEAEQKEKYCTMTSQE